MTTDEVLTHTDASLDHAGLAAILRVRGYPALCASSFLWHTTRWGGLFTTSYLLTHLQVSPMVNQVAGALLFAPMLIGGFLAGVISDRFDRRSLILATQIALVPVELVMSWLVQTGDVRVWMTSPYMFLLGMGGLVNMTAQRRLIYETVGTRFAGPAMTIEATAQAGSVMVGTLAGGAIIDHVGLGAAFLAMALLLCVSLGLLTLVPASHPAAEELGAPTSVREQVRAGRALVRRSARLRAMLMVTVVMNLCMFGYLPLVPVVAERFAVGATLAGLLAAAPGFGQIVGGLALTWRQPGRYFAVFLGGSTVGLVGLWAFATAPIFAVAAVALFVSGVGQSGFGSMQGLLAIESAEESERGVALGVLSTCIGALPIGTVLIGVLAAQVGTRPALTTSSLTGLAGVGVAVLLSRRALRSDPEGDGWVDPGP
ncbi:MFS transporter [Nocardioides sp. AN3]